MNDVSLDFVGGGSLVLSHELANLRIHRSCESGDITFFICNVTTILKCHMTLWVGSSHLKSPSHQPAKFGVHRPCKSKDIKFFYLSRDHVVDVSCDVVHEISSSSATTLQSLGSTGIVKVEIYCF